MDLDPGWPRGSGTARQKQLPYLERDDVIHCLACPLSTPTESQSCPLAQKVYTIAVAAAFV